MGIATVVTALSLVLAPVVAPAPAPSPSPKPPKTHKTGGSIYSYDVAAQSLTLKTSKGLETFSLAPAVQVWVGTKSVAPEDLASTVGFKVAVRYYESTGDGKKRIVNSIRVTPNSTTPKS